MNIPIVGKIIEKVIDKGASLISEFVTDKDEALRLEHEFRTLLVNKQHEFDVLESEISRDLEREFSKRTVKMEGTASDLNQFGFFGKIVVFMRGMFRPVFSYGVMYWDWVYFTTDTSGWSDQQQTLLLSVNMIVLVFFFGERALRNLSPLFERVFAK